MPQYVVLCADNPGLHPGDDYAPLEIQLHSGLFFWYREYSGLTPTGSEMPRIPQYWMENRPWKVGGRLLEATDLADLRAQVAQHQWPPPPEQGPGSA
jgi:hypothetical protein